MLYSLQIIVYKLIARILKLTMRFLPIPSPILFSGKDASLELCDAIVHRGCKKMLLVTDEMLMQLKLGSKIIQRLEDQGISVTVYSGVLPDPTTDQVCHGQCAIPGFWLTIRFLCVNAIDRGQDNTCDKRKS
jgi:hypothetical protein